MASGKGQDRGKAYEHSVARRKNWISGRVGTAVEVGTSFIATRSEHLPADPWEQQSASFWNRFSRTPKATIEKASKTGGRFWADKRRDFRQSQRTELEPPRIIADQWLPGDAGMTAREAAKQGQPNAQAIVNGAASGIIRPSESAYPTERHR
ncbi:hypothetical protein ACWGA9_38970 [Streptomyces sp. NPDC054950]